jgi:hypothetical protein
LLRTILPLPVILKRLATDLRVLLRAIDFGIGKGREIIESAGFCKQILQDFFRHTMRPFFLKKITAGSLDFPEP